MLRLTILAAPKFQRDDRFPRSRLNLSLQSARVFLHEAPPDAHGRMNATAHLADCGRPLPRDLYSNFAGLPVGTVTTERRVVHLISVMLSELDVQSSFL